MGRELSVHSGPEGLEAGGPCKLSLSSLHPSSPQPRGGAFQRLSLEAWAASQVPLFSAGPEAHRLSPEHREVTDNQRSAGLGRVLGTFSHFCPRNVARIRPLPLSPLGICSCFRAVRPHLLPSLWQSPAKLLQAPSGKETVRPMSTYQNILPY